MEVTAAELVTAGTVGDLLTQGTVNPESDLLMQRTVPRESDLVMGEPDLRGLVTADADKDSKEYVRPGALERWAFLRELAPAERHWQDTSRRRGVSPRG